MQGRLFALGLAAWLAGAGAAMAQGSPVTGDVVTLNCPGASLTAAADINDSGTIVGRCTVGGVTMGFIYAIGTSYADGTFTTFMVPGSSRTEASGINEKGEVVGYYMPAGGTRLVGFVRHLSGHIVTVDREGEFQVMPQDLNNAGYIVGCMHNAGTMHGWVTKGSTPLSVSPSYAMYTDVNESGTVIGWGFAAPASNVSFALSGVDRVELSYPGAANTLAYGLNQRGDIVGWFGPSSGGTGFRLRGGQFQPVAVSGASWTRAFGINSAGHIVGVYRAAATRAFVLVPSN